jgi:hypothetical protein
VHIAAPTVGGALVLVLGSMEVRTDLVSDGEENTVEMGLAGGYVLAVDDRAAVGTPQSGYQLSVEAWRVSTTTGALRGLQRFVKIRRVRTVHC